MDDYPFRGREEVLLYLGMRMDGMRRGEEAKRLEYERWQSVEVSTAPLCLHSLRMLVFCDIFIVVSRILPFLSI